MLSSSLPVLIEDPKLAIFTSFAVFVKLIFFAISGSCSFRLCFRVALCSLSLRLDSGNVMPMGLGAVYLGEESRRAGSDYLLVTLRCAIEAEAEELAGLLLFLLTSPCSFLRRFSVRAILRLR